MLTAIHPRRPVGIPGPGPGLGPGATGAPGGNDHRTVLLVQSDSTHGSTAFVDSSHGARFGTAPHTVTAGSGAHHTTARHKIGATGIDVWGHKHLSVPSHPDFDLGAIPEWTLDFWFWAANSAQFHSGHIANVMGNTDPYRRSGWGMFVGSLGLYLYIVSPQNYTQLISLPVPRNAWNHAAFVRSGTRLQVFLNGSGHLNASRTRAYATVRDNEVILPQGVMGARPVHDLWIGKNRSVGGNASVVPFFGYLDEVRISRWPRWTADFTPGITHYER